jgi:hypothetical protein
MYLTQDVATITKIAGVKAIRPVIRIPPPKLVVFRQKNTSVQSMTMTFSRPIGQFTVNDPKDSRLPPDALSTHRMTGVDKLHAEGSFGQGIKIGM